MSKLPFKAAIFWKVLPAVYVLAVIVWVVVRWITEYEITSADYGGTFVTATIFAYLVHLWLLPGEYGQPGRDDELDVEEAE